MSDNLEKFRTVLEVEYLRRECRLLQWLIAGVAVVCTAIMASALFYVTGFRIWD